MVKGHVSSLIMIMILEPCDVRDAALCDKSKTAVNYCNKGLHSRGLKRPGSPTEH